MTEPLVADLLDAWLDRWESLWAPSTVATHRSIVRRIKIDIGQVVVRALTVKRVEDFYADLATGRRHGMDGVVEPLAPGTVHRHHSALMAALTQAERWGWIDRNPASRAARVRPTGHRAHNLDPGGLGLIVRAIPPSSSFGVLVRVAAITGARRGELCALRSQDFDTTRSTLRIARAISMSHDLQRVERGTKTGKVRTVGIDRGTATYLQGLRHHREAQADRWGYTRDPNPFLFSPRIPGHVPLNPGSVSAQWIRWRKQLAPTPGAHDHLRFGDLRHLAVTQLLSLGVPVPTVAHRVGHSTPATTLRTYAHALPVEDHDSADLLASVLFRS